MHYFIVLPLIIVGDCYLQPMFEKARRDSRYGAPWLKAHVSRHVMSETRHGVMHGFCYTIFDLMSYLIVFTV